MRDISILMLVAGACSGCVIPIPHRRLHAYGVRGRVLDVDSHRPIKHASVVSWERNGHPQVMTNAEGEFEIQPVHGWHGALFIGPICLSLFPGFDITAPCQNVYVSAHGYQAESFFVSRTSDEMMALTDNSNGYVNINARIEDKCLQAGPLRLRRADEQTKELPTTPPSGGGRSPR